MTLPLLPILYKDGSVDFAVSVPVRYKECAKDLLSRIIHVGEWNITTVSWAEDVCSQVIVQNRPVLGIQLDELTPRCLKTLFMQSQKGSLLDLIVRNETYAIPPEHLLSKSKIDPSQLQIANIYSLIMADPKLGATWPKLIEMDAGTLFASIYHIWTRLEDPKKREDRRTIERLQSPEFNQSAQGQELERIYQSKVEEAMTRAQAASLNDDNPRH